ncbi:unnamed protein product, partial [Sphenostylis stenocarpa]
MVNELEWSVMVLESKRELYDADAYIGCGGVVGEVHVGLVSAVGVVLFEKED